MPQARTLSPQLRIAMALIGLVLLLLAGFCAVVLYEGPWNWWIAGFGILALLEAIDFLAAAFRRGGGWPTPAFFLLDLLTPW